MALPPRAEAFLSMIMWAEGTSRGGRNPYAVTYGYAHTIKDFSDHPAITGEWTGLRLPDHYCRAAGLKPGCRSTAAGAFQINKPTWKDPQLRKLYMPKSFMPEEQRAFTWEALIPACGARGLILDGRIEDAIGKCAGRWASFSGSSAGQPTRQLQDLLDVYNSAYERAKA